LDRLIGFESNAQSIRLGGGIKEAAARRSLGISIGAAHKKTSRNPTKTQENREKLKK
jgi:hypothetical protein